MDWDKLAQRVHAQSVIAGNWSDWYPMTKRHETGLMMAVCDITKAQFVGNPEDISEMVRVFTTPLASAAYTLLDLAAIHEKIGLNAASAFVPHNMENLQRREGMMARLGYVIWTMHQSAYPEINIRDGLCSIMALCELYNAPLVETLEEIIEGREIGSQTADT